jgi:tetratricopeptide (TPR) repeat protein
MPTAITINDLVSLCQRLRGDGRWRESENQSRRGLVQAVAHGGLLFENASNAYASGDMRTARARFARVGTVLPGVSAVHYNIGVCERASGRHGEACAAFRKALVLDPGAGGALESLAQSQSALGQAGHAIASALRLIRVRPGDHRALAILGFVAWKSDRLDIALPALKASLILAPEARDVDMNLANVLVRLQRAPEAISRYRRLARLVPTDPAAWLNLGVAWIASGDWKAAAGAYARYARLTRGRPWNQAVADPFPDLPAESVSTPSRRTAWHALEFELSQLRHLLEHGLLPADFEREASAYQALIQGLDAGRRRAVAFDLDETEIGGISRYHGRLTHLAATNWRESSHGPALNPATAWRGVEAAYRGAVPALTVIDDFLTPAALSALRRFCLDSTIWFELKGAGYLGAYFRDGFNDPLLLAIAEELSRRMPGIFADHPLRMIWAYSYEQSMVGINPHADFARINVNFWITPEEANLDPETGGLLIYRRPAPESWGFEQYNAAPGSEIMAFLGEDARTPIRVPHRQNRAVIFDSRLFHETDRLSFREGFENRRINITMLFGDH